MSDLEAYALDGEQLSGRLRGQRIDVLDWLAKHDGETTGELSVADAVMLASLAKARRDTLFELLKVDDAILIKLLQRIEALEQEARVERPQAQKSRESSRS